MSVGILLTLKLNHCSYTIVLKLFNNILISEIKNEKNILKHMFDVSNSANLYVRSQTD